MEHICEQGDKLETIEKKIDKLVDNINQFKIEIINAVHSLKLEQIAEISNLNSKIATLEKEVALLKEQLKTARSESRSPWRILSWVLPFIISLSALSWSVFR